MHRWAAVEHQVGGVARIVWHANRLVFLPRSIARIRPGPHVCCPGAEVKRKDALRGGSDARDEEGPRYPRSLAPRAVQQNADFQLLTISLSAQKMRKMVLEVPKSSPDTAQLLRAPSALHAILRGSKNELRPKDLINAKVSAARSSAAVGNGARDLCTQLPRVVVGMVVASQGPILDA